MKSKINFKSLLSGILIGAAVMGTANVFADLIPNQLVEAWIQDSTHKIMVDGKILPLENGDHILNYQGKLYTPARLVAEAVGAEVSWEEHSNSVIIYSPEPEVVEVEVEKEVIIDSNKAETKTYEELPARVTRNNVTLRINESVRYNKEFALSIDIENKTMYTIIPDLKNAYAEDADGNIYKSKAALSDLTNKTIDSYESVIDESIYFDSVSRDVKEVKIVIPINLAERRNNSWVEQDVDYILYIELDD